MTEPKPPDFTKVIAAINEKIPQEIRDRLALCGWNAFGIFEVVLAELKNANEPICCPHCFTNCEACRQAQKQHGRNRYA